MSYRIKYGAGLQLPLPEDYDVALYFTSHTCAVI